MEKDKRKGDLPIPVSLKDVLNEAQVFTLSKMEGFGWVLKFVRRPLFQDIVPVLFHPDSKHYGVLEEDGTLNTQPDIKIR